MASVYPFFPVSAWQWRLCGSSSVASGWMLDGPLYIWGPVVETTEKEIHEVTRDTGSG